MLDNVTKEGILVEIGQIWRNLDKRMDNRHAKVEAVRDGKVVMCLCTAEGRIINSMREVMISVARMHTSDTGWAMVPSANSKTTTVTPITAAISPDQLAKVSIEE